MVETSLIELSGIISDKASSLEFLCNRFKRKHAINCTSCNSKKYYVMSRARLRCQNCRFDYKPFENTWLGNINIDFTKWLALIKLFELGTSARRAGIETGTSYPTALLAFDCIRRSILYNLAKSDRKVRGEIEADEAYFGGKRKGNRGRDAKNKTIVFGILERGGKVHVEIVKNVKTKTLLHGTIKKVKRGSIVYTDMWHGYDSLMFHGYRHMSVDHSKIFARGRVYINGIEGFWSFAKEQLAKHHGIGSEKFLLYIKEMEWRYNNRDNDKFSLLVDYLLGVIPL